MLSLLYTPSIAEFDTTHYAPRNLKKVWFVEQVNYETCDHPLLDHIPPTISPRKLQHTESVGKGLPHTIHQKSTKM